ncbi:unnamed protein product [Lupinus luteus]|uniref:Transmembrane protein n=1 Tax=Lupinus luteus TaxID=3873 RepID=A0AAV1WKI6_LUPLU
MEKNLAPKFHSLLPEATSSPSIPFSFTSHTLQLPCASSSSTFRTISFSQHGDEASTVISFSFSSTCFRTISCFFRLITNAGFHFVLCFVLFFLPKTRSMVTCKFQFPNSTQFDTLSLLCFSFMQEHRKKRREHENLILVPFLHIY